MKDNEPQIMEAGYSMSPDMATSVDSLMKQIEILGLSEVRLQIKLEDKDKEIERLKEALSFTPKL